jgi:UDP-N-acetyl-2-amino-2-deoxyglucuronate dehydrogenase
VSLFICCKIKENYWFLGLQLSIFFEYCFAMMTSFILLGCGRIGERHAEQICKVGKLVSVCDIDERKANDFAKKYGATAYYDLITCLKENKDTVVVSICTPNGLHALHTNLCLQNGHHVLCEKPLSIKSQDAKQMIKTAEEYDKKLFVVKQNRYNPPVAFTKQLLTDKKLGQIFSFQLNCFWNRPEQYYTDWKGTKDLDGGTLYTQFSHFIDLLIWFFGDLKPIHSNLKNYAHSKIAFEDAGIITLETTQGAMGCINYSVNAHQQNMEGSLTILAEKGTIKIGGQYLNELEYFNVEGMQMPILQKGNGANAYGIYQGSMSNHDKVYENLITALQQPNHEIANAFDGLKTVELIEKIYQLHQ